VREQAGEHTFFNYVTMQSTCAEAATELRAVLTTPNVPEIRQMLSQIRPELAPDSLTFRAALLLLTGPAVAFNIDRLACRTQVPRSVVAACARRLFDNGVWHPDGPVYTWHAADEPKFWNDVAVAEGQLCRRLDRLGRIEWASAGAWRKAYDFGEQDKPSIHVEYFAYMDGERPAVEATKSPANGGTVSGSTPEASTTEASPAAEEARSRPWQRIPALAGSPEAVPAWLGAAASGDLFPGTAWLL
jgi:hypothetical protein